MFRSFVKHNLKTGDKFKLFYSIDKETYSEIKDILFEVTSAFCTVGYTLGITPRLSIISKIIICICMFIGRVGTLTLISMWLKEKKKPHSSLSLRL